MKHTCDHIPTAANCDIYASLLERYPWTRRHWDYAGRPLENRRGWLEPRWAMSQYPGWAQIFERLCGDIQQVLDKHGIPGEQFVIRQVKEKFARIRLYWSFFEMDGDGRPEKEIGKSGLVIDFLGSGQSGLFGSESAESMGYDRKYDEARDEIRKLLADAAAESYTTCIVCGSKEDIGYTKGWVVPICRRCTDAGIADRKTYWHEIAKEYLDGRGLLPKPPQDRRNLDEGPDGE